MPLGIEQIKAKTRASFAKPSLFRVDFTTPNILVKSVDKERLSINCFSATVPGMNIATTDKDQGYRSVAYQKIYDDIELGFYCGEDMKELAFLKEWINSIIRSKDNRVEYYEKYTGTIKIINLGSQIEGEGKNKKIMSTDIFEAYPKVVSPLTMDYGTNDAILTVNATFTYRYYEQTWHDQDSFINNFLNDGIDFLSTGGLQQNLSDSLAKTKDLFNNPESRELQSVFNTSTRGSGIFI